MTEASQRAAGAAGSRAATVPSRSLRGVVAAFAGLLVLAAVHYGPGVLAPDPGVERLAPTLFEPAVDVRGGHDLGGGLTASVFLSGLRVETPDGTVLKTTERAAPVLVLDGSVTTSDGRPAERFGAVQRSMTVDGVESAGEGVRWGGVATMTDGSRVRLELEVRRSAAGFVLALTAEQPVDGFAVALDPRYTDVLAPAGDARETWAWWPNGPPTLANRRLARPWRLAVAGGRVAVDHRTDGATILHVWGAAPTLTFTAPTVGS